MNLMGHANEKSLFRLLVLKFEKNDKNRLEIIGSIRGENIELLLG